MKKLKQLWLKNKVLITGAIGAIIIGILQLRGNNPTWYAISMASIVAFSSWVANNLRGQWASITGILLTVTINFLTMQHNNVPFDTMGLFMFAIEQAGILFFGYSIPPLKQQQYEEDPMIRNAKNRIQ
jgi:hypothetical protein